MKIIRRIEIGAVKKRAIKKDCIGWFLLTIPRKIKAIFKGNK